MDNDNSKPDPSLFVDRPEPLSPEDAARFVLQAVGSIAEAMRRAGDLCEQFLQVAATDPDRARDLLDEMEGLAEELRAEA